MSDQADLEYVKFKTFYVRTHVFSPETVFCDKRLMKICVWYLYKKIFEISIIMMIMAKMKQLSIIQDFTALWEIKNKEMAAISKSHIFCSKFWLFYNFVALDQYYQAQFQLAIEIKQS